MQSDRNKNTTKFAEGEVDPVLSDLILGLMVETLVLLNLPQNDPSSKQGSLFAQLPLPEIVYPIGSPQFCCEVDGVQTNDNPQQG